MKRSAIRRTTPLRARTAIKRSAPPKVRRRTKQERDVWATVKRLCWIRDEGCCRMCGEPGQDAHHRRLKSQGGEDVLPNVVLLCRACHDHVHAHRAEARAGGWILHAGDDAHAM